VIGLRTSSLPRRSGKSERVGGGNMSDVVVFLLLFAGCSGCVYMEAQDRERCIPQCGEYVYAGTTQNGLCVCNKEQVKR
jgi:hypothetical protein